jgi:Ni,Fe-hydrogenase III small subunit
MIRNLKILLRQGRQSIPDLTQAGLPGIFRGRPEISSVKINEFEFLNICPANAISLEPLAIDLGKCTFCNECALAFPEKIQFTTDYRISTNERERLMISEGKTNPIRLKLENRRPEIQKIFKRSLKLRQVSAGGDNSSELELNACSNVNFDMGRFGIEFVASPRHADGLVITGPITENMARPLELCYQAMPAPKIIILAGTDAISGGIFTDSPALDRRFLLNYKIDLFVPGNPVHPLTFINGILNLIGRK